MDDTVDTYQQALQASSRMSYDLGTGAQTSFIYDVDGFAFASARPPSGPYQLDPSGQITWHKYIIYYTDNGILYRNEVPISPPVASLPATPLLPDLKTQMTGAGAIVAENISDLEVVPGSGVGYRFKVQGEQDDTNSVTLEGRMTFRQ